jgi:hypothetical protein
MDIDVEKGEDYVDCSNMMFISDQKNDEPKFTTRYERTVGLTIPCIGFGEK